MSPGLRVIRAAVAVSLLLALFTWLLLRGMNLDAAQFDRAYGAIDRFAMLESALRRDVLLARTGMLRNYDRMVREVDALDDAIRRLRTRAAFDDAAVAAIDRLAELLRVEQEAVEQFKSDNALLQNSLAYFGMVSARLGEPSDERPPLPAVSALAAAMLRLTLDTSPAAMAEVAQWLDTLSAGPDSEGDAEAIEALVRHGRMIHHLLPATDERVKALLALPTARELSVVRNSVLARQTASHATSERFRLLLYVASLLLLGILVYLGLRLRGRAQALHCRAAFERLTTGISTRFISAPPDAIDAHVDRALAELATRLGAERAYFASADGAPQAHAWCADGVALPAGWPARALALAGRLQPTATGLIHVPRVGRLPPGAAREVLTAVGVRGWACIVAPGGTAILAFDALRPGLITRSDDLGFLRAAFDAIANALDRKSLEAERSRLASTLQQARRLETVGTLASGIAHNVNNIVGAMLGYAEMAEAQVARGTRAARYLGEIRRAGERARDVVDQILTFGKSREVRRAPLSVRGLIADAQALLLASLPPQVTLVIHPPPAEACIVGDLAQLQQVIVNLCNNAAQAMDGAGQVDLDTELREIDEPCPVSDGTLVPGRYVRIAVVDRGRGMDDAVKARIFEPFFTTRVTGNGLGLATVREIVRAHGGMMNVVSAPRVGTRMEAWLPAAASQPVADDRAPGLVAPESTLPLGHGETVLVIDAESRRLLQDEEMLAALGYEPVGFIGVDEATSAGGLAEERFDAIIVCSPGARAGVAVSAAANRAAPRLPIVLATSPADAPDADALAAAGIAEVVRCPLIAAEIAAALGRCRQRRGVRGNGRVMLQSLA